MRQVHFSELTARSFVFLRGSLGLHFRNLAVMCEDGETSRITFAFGGMTVSDRMCDQAPDMLAEFRKAVERSYEAAA